MADALNGAEAVVRTLAASGVEVCFANPGTSEMHLVTALDAEPSLRPVLALFEGVATGAADGWARMTGRPAAALMHLGPGLANGMANLHNARRARSPVVALVGDHATYHKRLDAPLESDIDSAARAVAGWFRRTSRPEEAGADAATAVAASIGPPGRVAALVLPADVGWGEGASVAAAPRLHRPGRPDDEAVADAARRLRSGERCAILIGGNALRGQALRDADRVARASGALLLTETFPARVERGRGRPVPDRLGYFAEGALAQLDGCRHLLLVGATEPVAFFAYPGRPGSLVPLGCSVVEVAGPGEDSGSALAALAAEFPPPDAPVPTPDGTEGLGADGDGGGPLDLRALGFHLAARLPEGAVVVDEAITAGAVLARATAGAAPHDWLTLTGGAIGSGLPVATGAAVACADRRVFCLEGDGSAMYTVQALWTQAREQLPVTTIVMSNRTYSILRIEIARVQARQPGEAAASVLDLDRPDIDFSALASGMGVPSARAETAAEFADALDRSLAEPGPFLIDAVLPAGR